MKDSTKYANNYNILQKRLCEDGYLLIRNFIKANHAESIRESISLKLWNKPNYSSSLITGDDPRTSSNYNSAYSLECVHQLWHSSRIKTFFEKLFKEEVLMHPKIVLRNSYKGTFTPAHQDWPQVQGAKDTLSVWIALNNIEKKSGLLEIAENSHKDGVRDHIPHAISGGMMLNQSKFKWLSTNMKAGDAIIFTCLTVHKTEKNISEKVRQSIDTRFQKRSSPVCINNLNPFINDKWENIYKSWKDNTYSWYWKDWDLNEENYDSYFEINNAIKIMQNFNKSKGKWKTALQKINSRSSSKYIRDISYKLLNNND